MEPGLIADGKLVFGARTTDARDTRFRLYALDVKTRRGALPDGDTHLPLPVTPYSEVRRHGRYTLVGAHKVLVLGDGDNR